MKPLLLIFFLLLSSAPVLAAEEELTLAQAITIALDNDPSIQASSETAKASGYKAGTAFSGYLPQLSASLGYKRSTANSPALPDTTASAGGGRTSSDSYNNFSTSLNLAIPIWDFGKTTGTHESAKALRDAAESDLTATRDSTIYLVIQGYYAVLANQEALASAQENKVKMEKHLELAQTQLQAGLRQRIDVLRAQSDLSSADLALVQARNALSQARLNLATVMGTGDRTEFTAVRSSLSAAVPDADGALKQALQKRAEYRSLMQKIQAAEGTITASRSGYYPSLSANGAFGYAGYELPHMAYNWTVGASLSWDLFSGLGTMNSVSEAIANQRALQAQLKSLELSIRNDIGSALIGLQEAQEKIGPAEMLLTSAKETLSLAEERYAAGLGSIVEITDAQLVYTQARIQTIQAAYDLEMARANYLKATGRITEFMKKEP